MCGETCFILYLENRRKSRNLGAIYAASLSRTEMKPREFDFAVAMSGLISVNDSFMVD